MKEKNNVSKSAIIIIIVLVLALYVYGQRSTTPTAPASAGQSPQAGESPRQPTKSTVSPMQSANVLRDAKVNPFEGVDNELNPFK